jgi:FtsP/CotA-like multicopper oxidase with cupredoxin domain
MAAPMAGHFLLQSFHPILGSPHSPTIYWHGLPVPPDQDGNPSDALAPGATRVYRFALPPASAGTYWYHPHPHRLSAEQVHVMWTRSAAR